MPWQKIGKIFDTHPSHKWKHSHSMIPIAYHLHNDIFRIFYSVRDAHNRGHGAFFDVDITNPFKPLVESVDPVLEPGKLGCFDDSGALPNCIVKRDKSILLYYTGINLGVTVKIRNSIGLAKWSENKNKFERLYEGPIIDRTKDFPHFVATPHIIFDEDDLIFKAWFTSCQKWSICNNEPRHFYNIEYAESSDGINWDRMGLTAIDFKDSAEYALGVPRIIKNGVTDWDMWFCARASENYDTYRIYHARSDDGKSWSRDSAPCLDTSETGWDSQMVCYPFVFHHKGKKLMLYNGNYYGKSGIGLAEFKG